MAKDSLVDFCSEDDKKRLLNFRPASELRKLPAKKSTPRASVPAATVPAVVDPTPSAVQSTSTLAPAGCEFAGKCGFVCAAEFFRCPSLYKICLIYVKKLEA